MLINTTLNNPEYKYISSNILMDNVKNKLHSYFAQGSLDDSYLYPVLRSCLDMLSLKVHPTMEDVVIIENKMGNLPTDFYKLIFAIGVGERTFTELPTDFVVPKFTEKLQFTVDKGTGAGDLDGYCGVIDKENFGDLYQFTQVFDGQRVTYSDLFSVQVVDSQKHCTTDGLNNSPQEFQLTIRNNKIFSNFNGCVYIKYLSTMMNEDDEFIVPDYTQITDWIETAMMVNCFEALYLNNEGDVLQRLQMLQQSLEMKKGIAKAFVKQLELQDMYDVSNVLKSRFRKFKKSVRGTRLQSYTYNTNSRY